MDALGGILEVEVNAVFGTPVLDFMFKVAAGRIQTPPFGREALEGVRKVIGEFFEVPEADRGVAPGQCMRLGFLARMLEVFDDPDFKFIKELENGVPLGLHGTMPRAPLIYQKKTRWNVEEASGEDELDRDNYKSTLGHEGEIEKLFKEEEALGWMEEMSEEQAKQRFKDTLRIGSLGAVIEPEKVRVVHDGTHGINANRHVRIRDQVQLPGAGELEELLRERKLAGRRGIAVVGDAHKAHRRIKVREADWGYMGCRLTPGRVWINRVGTYGFSSAGYFWSRFGGAVMVRLVHYHCGKKDYRQVFCSGELISRLPAGPVTY